MRNVYYALVALLLGSCGAQADVVFNDPVLWANALAGPATTTNFEGLAPVGGFTFIGTGPGTNISVGGNTFSIGPSSNGNLFVIGDNFYYPGTAVLSSQLSTTPFNDLQITLPSPVTALGFSFGDFEADTATITLSDGTVALPTAVAAPYLGFFGVTSSTGITSVDISTPDPVLNVANFSTGTAAAPEPAYRVLMAFVIAAMVFAFRRRILSSRRSRYSGATP